MSAVARLRNLQPAYFALVMATEIVATSCNLEGLGRTAQVMTVIGVAAFFLLAVWSRRDRAQFFDSSRFTRDAS